MNFQALEERDEVLKDRQRQNYDVRHRTKDLPQLDSGDYVWLLDRVYRDSIVTDTASRSFVVDTPDRSFHKNCQHLTMISKPQVQEQTAETSEETSTSRRETRSQTG